MVLALHTVNQVDEIIKRVQAQGRAPSVIAGVVRDGILAHVSAAGDTPVPDRDLQYRIGSISKTLTAALLLQLRDEGKLSLDDPIADHLPVTGLDTVRLRQLLGQVAGLQREPDGEWWERSAGAGLDELVSGISAAKHAFPPYQRFHYSNLGFGLLGGVIEQVTGTSWWEALSDRLLGPLGMHRTTYQPAEPFARGYVVHPWLPTLREEPRHDARAMAPAGQLWSTLDDLARWAAVLAAPEASAVAGRGFTEPSVLAPATLAEMRTPVVLADLDSWTEGYGLGLQLWRRGDRVYLGHTGSMPGYLAVLVVHRPSGTAVLVFANTYSLAGDTIGQLGLSIMDTVLAGEPAPYPIPWRPSQPPPSDIEGVCGRWWWMGREFEVGWDDQNAQLTVHSLRNPDQPWRFTKEDTDRWRGQTGEQAGEVLRIMRDEHGTPLAVDIATFVFSRDPLPPR